MEEQNTIFNPEEREKPLQVLVQLFDAQSITDYGLELWELLKATTMESSWTYQGAPGTAVFLQKQCLRLLEALSLLLQNYESTNGAIVLQHLDVGSEKRFQEEKLAQNELPQIFTQHFGKVKRLRLAEVENPFLAVRACLDFKSLADWHQLLENWVEYALCSSSYVVSTEDTDFLLAFEFLEKMLEVAYLLVKKDDPSAKMEERETRYYLHTVYGRGEEQWLSGELFHELKVFFRTVNPKRLNRTLRKVFFDYLQYNHKCGLPLDFEDYLFDLDWLGLLLDVAEDELPFWKGKEEDDAS
ncbi:MAG: hypothetical protein KKE39_06520 [Bacteroidetes bacterium]|nr:hypothetical protein [Bacteroidota bacterium]MBU1373406.1 hypothetical protein [Bacteroidota bacterium]MBU1483865.1 hypothetical protein [Bacteroidota bacterium]MBU1760679.1 hypothetical protein [Bacteroidota bacterium]MBU2046983.1 hypothetical protein [Bacteroidota bacterium]